VTSRALISCRAFTVASAVGVTVFGLGLSGVTAQAQSVGYSAQASADAECPNQAFRTLASARLPDCRAHEMVSPVDKGGIGISVGCNTNCQRAGIVEGTPGGEKLTYSSAASFGDQPGAPYSSQYIASRGVEGWSSHGINAPRDNTIYGTYSFFDLNTQYDAFTEDLSTAWLHNDNLTPLTADALHGTFDLYKRDNTADSYEALTNEEAMIPPREGEPVTFAGHSADGSHSVFLANNVLYDAEGNVHRVVNVLPDGTISNEPHLGAYVGVDYSGYGETSVEHAISDDGSRIFWTDSESTPGNLYVRIDGSRTIPISTTGIFRDASTDGSEVLFDTGAHDGGSGGAGSLYQFDVDTQTTHLIADEEYGVLGASDDLSYIYFVSKASLAPSAEEGQFNLYLDHEGEISRVAALSPEDVGLADGGQEFYNGQPDVVSRKPIDRPARVTPDGRHIVFDSVGSLTGYDNTDAVTGAADVEVFRYDADAHRLTCVSCNPSGARPVGQPLPKPYTAIGESISQFTAAAWLPTSETSLYSTRPLSDDGDRVFFNSFDSLVPRDGNSAQDVYEWEAAGSGDCSEQSPAFSDANGGCLSLISSGESPGASEFVDASSSGDDVFFTTEQGLVPQDPGLVDIYDARVDGGFPAPQVAAASCEGEACQSPPAPPRDATPASASFSSPPVKAVMAPKATVVAPKRKTASQVRANELAKALKACRAKTRAKRKGCEVTARKRYGERSKSRAKKSTKGGK
jgi:hypothetical protein